MLADEVPLCSGRLPPDAQGRQEVIKGTKVDLGVCQVYLNRGHWVHTASVVVFLYY